MAEKHQSEQCVDEIRAAAARVCTETNTLRDAMIEQVRKQIERKYDHDAINSHDGMNGDSNSDSPLYFEPGNFDVQKLQSILGRLEVTENDIKNVQLKAMSSFQNSKESVDVLLSTSKGFAWVCDDRKHLCLVDKLGRAVVKRKIDHVPESIAISDNGTVFFTSYKEKAIKKLDVDGKVGYVLNTSPLHPVGLSLTSGGDLLVCVVDTFDFVAKKGKPKEILKVKIDGDVVISVKFKDDQESLTAPYRVLENINGDVLVIDGLSATSGRLVVFNGSGDVKSVYKGDTSVSGNGGKFCPTNFCIDYKGNIFVLDGGSHCVHVLNSSAELQREVTADEIGGGHPTVISIGRDGYMWVGHANGEVAVFMYGRPTGYDISPDGSAKFNTNKTYF